MKIHLYPHQLEAVQKLDSGSILCGGVGSGKSITSLAYYWFCECGGGSIDDCVVRKMRHPKNLYIITTARKRDTKEWEYEIARFTGMSRLKTQVVVDSWNNLHKYVDEIDSFFIFDEQRVVGNGQWVRSFLKVSRKNRWILLSATPGDTWMDYIPVFIANGFYRNRTEFYNRHVVFQPYVNFQKVKSYKDVGYLESLRRRITVVMDYKTEAVEDWKTVVTDYDSRKYMMVLHDRWDPYANEPAHDISKVCYLLRQVSNSDPSRFDKLCTVLKRHPRVIVFYNFNYELDVLRKLSAIRTVAEWNGQRHDDIPDSAEWVYLVQYTAGAEGWNCTTTDTIVFYSQCYSYKTFIQAAGRINRLNSPFSELHYYIFKTASPIDQAISKTLRAKKSFNEKHYMDRIGFQ